MNIDLMRKLDYYAGTPICFILSIIYKIKKIIIKKKGDIKIKKILFIQISEMGSAVYSYSAVKKARQLYPDASIYYLIFDEMKDILYLMETVPKNNVITIRGKSIFYLLVDTIKVLWKLRREKIDVAVDLELFSRVSSILGYLSGAKIRAGFNKLTMEGLYRGDFQTHKVSYNNHTHIGQNFLSLVYSLKNNRDIPLLKKRINRSEMIIPKLKSSQKERSNIMKRLKGINKEINFNKKIILINPNASQLLPLRKWPLKSYCELAKGLLKDKDVFIIITGVKGDKRDAIEIRNYVKSRRCIDLTGKTSLRDLIDLYNISEMIITNDSGPVHFASLTGIKIFAFYGPETPELYGPLGKDAVVFYSNFACSPCVSAYNHRKSICKDNKCLQVIKVGDVYREVYGFLDKK